jgi:hypothetical protein
MKRAKQMQTLARQRYEHKVVKGLKDIKAGRVYSDEQVEAETNLLFAILEAKQASGAMQFKRKARTWWKHRIEDDETASDIVRRIQSDMGPHSTNLGRTGQRALHLA